MFGSPYNPEVGNSSIKFQCLAHPDYPEVGNSSINLQCLAHPDNPEAAVGSDLEVT